MSPVRAFFLCLISCSFLTAVSVLSGKSGPNVQAEAERFFKDPHFLRVSPSPNGEYLAILTHHQGARSLLHLNLVTGEFNTGATVTLGQDIDRFWWVDEHTLVYLVSLWDHFYVGAQVFRVDDGSRPHRMEFLQDYRHSLIRDVVHPLPRRPGQFLATLAGPRQRELPDLYMVDVREERASLVAKNPGSISTWFCDNDGNLIGGIERVRNRVRFRAFNGEAGEFDTGSFLPDGSLPLGVSLDGAHFLIRVTNEDRFFGVVPWDLRTQETVGDPFELDGYDAFSRLVYDNHTFSPIGVAYHTDKPGIHWYDRTMHEVFTQLQESSPNLHIGFLGFGADRSQLLLQLESDVQNPAIIALDLTTGDIQTIALKYPGGALADAQPMEPISFSARDGTVIHGYLTRAAGVTQPTPTVALIHGGPWVRDTWGFDAETQYYAALGFNVLQVNYRGSSGYGPPSRLDLIDILELSPLDVIDGVRWLIDEGIADPRHIGAVGFSFGGYLSMEVAAREPELFRAVVSSGAVYDWPRQYREDSRSFRKAWAPVIFLDFEKHADRFHAASPVNRADRVEAAVYLFHGRSDSRVPASQARVMRRALRRSGNPPRYDVRNWGVHGFPKESDRIRYYREVGEFLVTELMGPN